MRVVAFLLLCAVVACAAVAGDAVPAAAAPAPAAAAPAPVAAATPAAPAAVPAAADVAALAAVQRGVEDLRSASLSSASELKAAQQATDSKVAALAATVEQGLQKLYAADAVQTAADEAQAKAATAGASADVHKSTLEKIQAETKARLESVEKELSELKKMLASFVAAAPKSADPAIAEIKAQTSQILAQLANATAAWSFDHEQILSQLKTASYSMSSRATKFVQRSYASFMQNYPTYAAQARELLLEGADHAQVIGGQAQQLSADAHLKLTQLLQANGVPKEFVQYAALSVLGLVALLLTMLLWSILKCLCRCCCCRSGKVAKSAKAAKANK